MAKRVAEVEFRRIQLHKLIGMEFSKLIASFIIIAAATLSAHALTPIDTSAQAAYGTPQPRQRIR